MDALDAPGVALDPRDLLHLRHPAQQVQTRRRPRHGMLPGTIVSRRRGHGLEIDDIRPWTRGDDIRHIDRNVTARTGEPHVRTFRDEREHTVLLVADFRPSMLFGTRRAFRSVAAAQALALVGWRAVAEGGRVGLLTIGANEIDFTRPGSGERAMRHVLAHMARTHRRALLRGDERDPPLSASLETAARCAPRNGTVVLATGLDAPGPGCRSLMAALRHRAALGVILVLDAFERDAPPGGYPFVTGEGIRGWVRVDRSRPVQRGDGRADWLQRADVRSVRVHAQMEPHEMALALEALDG